MSDHDHAHDAGHHDEAHGGMGTYLAVFVALCILTGASFFTTSSYWPFPDKPHVGWAFMMAVSCTKATLVILFFMHLLWEANWKYVLTLPAMFMSVFLMLMLVPDVGRRLDHVSEERQLHMAVPKKVSTANEENSHQDHADPHDDDHAHGKSEHAADDHAKGAH